MDPYNHQEHNIYNIQDMETQNIHGEMNIWRESDGELKSYPAKKNAIVNIKAKRKSQELPTKLYRENSHVTPLRGGIEKLMQLSECLKEVNSKDEHKKAKQKKIWKEEKLEWGPLFCKIDQMQCVAQGILQTGFNNLKENKRWKTIMCRYIAEPKNTKELGKNTINNIARKRKEHEEQ